MRASQTLSDGRIGFAVRLFVLFVPLVLLILVFLLILLFKRSQDAAERRDQLVPRDAALAKLNAQAKGFAFRLKIEDERLRARAGHGFFAPFPASLIARQSALQDALQRFSHFLFVGLPRDLQKQRLRDYAILHAPPANLFRDISQG